MNKFDEKYEIRRIFYKEIPRLQDYIRTQWKKDHLLVRDKAFFEYEYCIDNKVNFVVAISRKTNEIVGMIGYIQASVDYDHLDIWPTMWKVNKDAMPLLGIELYKRLFEFSGARNILGCGNNHETSGVILDMIMRYKNMKMKHYYRLSSKDEYRIAIVKTESGKRSHEKEVEGGYKIERINNSLDIVRLIDGLEDVNNAPYKDKWYYIHRFFDNPIYRYEMWKITKNSQSALLVAREQEYNGSKAYRIVEFAGPDRLFGYLYDFFGKLLEEYEYVDFYEYGMSDDDISMAGFTALDDSDDVIIPNYFAPYTPQNVDIWVSAKDDVKARFFKADGDQDRPN